ncbi:MAG: SLC13 family permease [Halorhodospira halophila]|uniref:SLC13 family permease n=1 Tax=Halorhodospira TaxID=85108 RepID=UPI001912D311|nr:MULTISPECIES: SLC13 family permease [Halorhodospira]MBK5936072.1 anion transporter [Halorhodospira halophila]MBK5943160.1 anion transporter [Halorhodospira halophila]MCC3751301.1 SLC13 family permease [Halorhodospira halophila]MCG5538648.1 SLC13 family permease [Halorhodospira sp. 9622]MCG5540429.1 SLC13 family permease [Halorhodospira sp. M39old]
MESYRQRIGLFLGPLVALAGLLVGPPGELTQAEWNVALVAILMAIWWISEALPLAATALVPIVAFPLLGVMEVGDVTEAYGNHLIYLFLGGFFIAVTMQRWNLHRRIALHTINLVGPSPRRIILGFMLATAGLSMWISNTATAMMMLPIALAVLKQSQEEAEQNGQELPRGFGVVLMLGVAYAASIGGIATLIGTPPNAVLAGQAQELYDIEITFASWMAFGLPLSLLFLGIAWVYLAFSRHCRGIGHLVSGRETIRQELAEIGRMDPAERRVLSVFVLVALAWVLRGFLPEGVLDEFGDASIAMAGALALFLLPSGKEKGQRLLDWDTAVKIPWDIVLLFGGGFALAAGFGASGLSESLAEALQVLDGVSIFLIIAACVALVVFLTEVTSNTATATVFIPLMGALAVATNFNPLVLMAAVAVAASCAFMLPVATPPNAVVFGSRALTVPDMARAGLLLNLVTIVLTTVFVYFLLPVALGVELTTVIEKQ